jgi:ABC-2 type transport system permease protein
LTRGPFEEGLNPARSLYYQPSDGQQYVLAAHIQGKPSGAKKEMNVVLVADVDMVGDQFFRWREAGGIPGLDIDISFDNVNFALNALDSLAGDERFLELRKRRPQHRTLQGFEEHTKEAKKESAQARKEKSKEHDDSIRKAVAEGQAKVKELGREVQKGNVDDASLANKLAIIQKSIDRKLEEQKAESDRKYNDEMRKINEAQDGKIRAMQGTYKFWAVVIPPIPPLFVAALVFFNRRAKEREGVSSKRLR